ncbi:MAG: hypothetical protein O3A46_06935 [Candidatus Poribacteria bacterium]|nr:hypothetical protein [Candidatus Poribacteria bacterium]
MRTRNTKAIIAYLIGVACLVSSALASAESVRYTADILPILKRSCQGCHNPADPAAGLAVTTHAELSKGGASGPAFVAGNPDESLLIRLISGDKPAMPKFAKPLTPEEVDLFRAWITEGAQDDAPSTQNDPINAVQPPVYTVPPVISALAYSPDGKTLAVSGFREVLLHQSDGSGLIARLVGEAHRIESITFSTDGAVVCAVGGTPAQFGEAQLWNAQTHGLIRAIRSTYDNLYGVSLSADGKYLAFGCGDKTARVVSTEDGSEVLKFDNHSDWVFGTQFSQDGSHVVTGSRDGALKLVNVSSGQFIDDINASNKGFGGINAIARHPKTDQVLSAGIDRVPRLYRIFRETTRDIGNTDFNLVREFEPQSGSVNAVCFNADGSRVAIGAANGETRIYNVSDGSLVASMQGDDVCVFALAFHPDGTRLAVGGFDGKTRLFDANTGQLILAFVSVPIGIQ